DHARSYTVTFPLSPSLSRFHKPTPRRLVRLQKSEESLRDLPCPGSARVSAVGYRCKIPSFPCQTVARARRRAVGPEIGSPQEDGSDHLSLCRIGVVAWVTFDLLLDQAAHRKGTFVGKRLRIEIADGVPGVRTAGEVHDAEIGVASLGLPHDHA